MTIRRGEIVLVPYPFSSGESAKLRPAVVVLNNQDNGRLAKTVVAMITRLKQNVLEPTQLLIDVATPEGRLSGLRQNSVVNCVNLLTVDQARILRTIGTLAPPLLKQLDGCLRAALEIS